MQQKREVKTLLAESFKELALEKPVEKITIKEITDRAGVIRVTFYIIFRISMSSLSGSAGRRSLRLSVFCLETICSGRLSPSSSRQF